MTLVLRVMQPLEALLLGGHRLEDNTILKLSWLRLERQVLERGALPYRRLRRRLIRLKRKTKLMTKSEIRS